MLCESSTERISLFHLRVGCVVFSTSDDGITEVNVIKTKEYPLIFSPGGKEINFEPQEVRACFDLSRNRR